MLSALSRLAAPYTALLGDAAGRCAEPPYPPPDERLLQAFWKTSIVGYTSLKLPDGTPVTILDPGQWHRSLGPDFSNAVILIGNTRYCGDVELHLHPGDWDTHRHAQNPDFQNLILHVAWYDGPPPKTLPADIPTLCLRPFVEPFDFSTLDLSGAPYPAETPPHLCLSRFSRDPVTLNALLRAAGYHRFFLKTKAFATAFSPDPNFQVFYEALLRAMGYHRNTAPFLRLAAECPFEKIQSLSTLQRFAALAGTAGLLTEKNRDLWDRWWLSSSKPPLSPYVWDMRAMRPQNHPLLRLAGAMGILHHITRLLETPLDKLPAEIATAGNYLKEDLKTKTALIGKDRAVSLLVNIFVPYRLALGTLAPEKLTALPGESTSTPIKETWHRLTGTLNNLPKDGLRRQGLIQIYTDFCRNPAVLCDTCPVGTFLPDTPATL